MWNLGLWHTSKPRGNTLIRCVFASFFGRRFMYQAFCWESLWPNSPTCLLYVERGTRRKNTGRPHIPGTVDSARPTLPWVVPAPSSNVFKKTQLKISGVSKGCDKTLPTKIIIYGSSGCNKTIPICISHHGSFRKIWILYVHLPKCILL